MITYTETLGVPVIEGDPFVPAIVVVQQDMACLVLLFRGPTPVGSIRWGLDDGVITMIEVHPEHRRKGFATGMLGMARAIAAARGWPLPLHEPDWEQVSEAGRAWRRALGEAPDTNETDTNPDTNEPGSSRTVAANS